MSHREALQQLAKKAQVNLVDNDESVDSALKWQCMTSAQEMVSVLQDSGYDPVHVTGVLVGDCYETFDVEVFFPAAEQRAEHGRGPFPSAPFEYRVGEWTVGAEYVNEVGVEHHWVEVEIDGQYWIVEPYAEMRGTYEYKPVATPVKPVDYQYIEGRISGPKPSERWPQNYI